MRSVKNLLKLLTKNEDEIIEIATIMIMNAQVNIYQLDNHQQLIDNFQPNFRDHDDPKIIVRSSTKKNWKNMVEIHCITWVRKKNA